MIKRALQTSVFTGLMLFGAVAQAVAQATFGGELTGSSSVFTTTPTEAANGPVPLDDYFGQPDYSPPPPNPASVPFGQSTHSYELFSFQVSQSDPAAKISLASQTFNGHPGMSDPVLFVYQGLIPQNGYSISMPGLIAENDDGFAAPSHDSLVNLSLVSGTTYTLVLLGWNSIEGANAFNESPYGGYQISFNTLGTITPIPEPATYAVLLGVATLGLVGWRRWRQTAVAPAS
jgi:hypothetical protein